MKMRKVPSGLTAGITAMSGMRTWLRGKNRKPKSLLATYPSCPALLARLKKCGSNPNPSKRSTSSNAHNVNKGTTKTANARNSHLRRNESAVAEPTGRVVGGGCSDLPLCFRFMRHQKCIEPSYSLAILYVVSC